MKNIITSLLLVFAISTFAQTGIGTTTPNSSAQLEVASTTKGFLPPRVALTGTDSASPLTAHVAGMVVYNTATVSNVTPGLYVNNGTAWTVGMPAGTATGEMQYWNGTAWVVIPATINEGATLTAVGGVPTWTGGTPPPPSVTSITGRIWMDRNLGATQVATSSTDTNSYGYLYQWGRGTDGHQIRASLTTSTIATTAVPSGGNTWDGLFIKSTGASSYDWLTSHDGTLWQGVNAVNNPCPSGYRVPTSTELDAERAEFSTQNAAGAFASSLKLPLSGLRTETGGTLSNVGTSGHYWSSNVVSVGVASHNLYFTSATASIGTGTRAYGKAVRCIKD